MYKTLFSGLAISFLPPLLYTLGVSNSLALGVFLSSILIIFINYKGVLVFDRHVLVVIPIFILASLQAILTPFEYRGVSVMMNYLLLATFAFSSYCFYTKFRLLSQEKCKRFMFLMYYILLAVLISSFFGFGSELPNSTYKPVFPFAEPSHFALCFAPFLIFAFYNFSSIIFFINSIILLFSTFAIENLTLLSILAFALLLRVRYSILLAVFLTSALFIFSMYYDLIDINYYTSRLDTDTNNLSSQVIVQGYEIMKSVLFDTNLLGVGMGNMNYYNGPLPDISTTILLQNGQYININDLGVVVFKFVAEYGILGVVITLFVFYSIFVALKNLIQIKRPPLDFQCFYVFAISFTFYFFFKGSGYFSSAVFFYFVYLCFYFDKKVTMPLFSYMRTFR